MAAPPGHALPAALRAALDDLSARGLRRTRRSVSRPAAATDGARLLVDGRECVDFSSNDYLDLAAHPAVQAAFIDAATRHGVGARASHLVSGHHPEHQALEEALAAHTGRERAVLFSTGYMANLGLAAALVGRGDAVFEDRLNHASLLDAGLLSGARLARYAHADPEALRRRLGSGSWRQALVLTDGVFSMDGDIAPLPALARVCADHGAWLAVDDAHGLGVLGASGRGAIEHHGLDAASVPVLVGTLGKAIGCFGAFVAGSAELAELLVQRARSYVYTTALPPAVAAAARAALAVSVAEPWRRERALALAARFRALAGAAGLPLAESTTPIQPLLLGDARAAADAGEALLVRGFLVGAIRPPSVPVGGARLRITLSATHQDSQVEQLVAALAETCARAAA